jgi:hypothetical protein
MKRYYILGFPIDLLAILLVLIVMLLGIILYFRKGGKG